MNKNQTREWFQTVVRGDAAAIREALDGGVDLDARTDGGATALMLAARSGRLDIIDLLLDAGAEIDATLKDEAERGFAEDKHPDSDDCDLVTALHHAIAWEQTDAALHLLASGASPAALDGDQVPPLVLAADTGDLRVVDALLTSGAPVDQALDATALHAAAERGHPEVVRRLIAAGAEIDWRDEDGWTALMKATSDVCHVGVIQALIEAGAKVNVFGQGDTPILLAADLAHREAVELLAPHVPERARRGAEKRLAKAIELAREHPKIAVDLVNAAIHGDVENLRSLINAGAPLNYHNLGPGKTALMYAACYGLSEAVDLLLAAGADPDAGAETRNHFEKGRTALMEAATSFHATNRLEIVKRLVDGGASLNAKDALGRTALLVVLDHDQNDAFPDTFLELLRLGADPTIRDDKGRTPESSIGSLVKSPHLDEDAGGREQKAKLKRCLDTLREMG